MDQAYRVPMPELNRANGSDVAQWLANCATNNGKPCSRTTEAQWRQRWGLWKRFCERHGEMAYPFDPKTLNGFILDSAICGLSQRTVRKTLRTLRAVLANVGRDDSSCTDIELGLRRLADAYDPNISKSGAMPPDQAPAPVAVGKPKKPRRKRASQVAAEAEEEFKLKGRWRYAAEPSVRAFKELETQLGGDRGLRTYKEMAAAVERAGAQIASSISDGTKPGRAATDTAGPGGESGTYTYQLPQGYAESFWTYNLRVREQARAAWVARRAVRDQVPEALKLISLGLRQLLEDGHQEIGSALLLGAVSGAGGFKTVAAAIGTSRSRVAGAFHRDEVPGEDLVKAVVLYLCSVVLSGKK